MQTQWAYRRAYDGIAALRPHLQLELVARKPVLPTEICLVEPLVDKLAGRVGAAFSVPVVSVAETLAEKVLSFLRRFAQHRSGQRQHGWDKALVRHIYDVHCIVERKPEVLADSFSAFGALADGDVQEFGYQDAAFAANARSVLERALQQVAADVQAREDYVRVLLPLVYGQHKFSFEEAFASFDSVGKRLLATLA